MVSRINIVISVLCSRLRPLQRGCFDLMKELDSFVKYFFSCIIIIIIISAQSVFFLLLGSPSKEGNRMP